MATLRSETSLKLSAIDEKTANSKFVSFSTGSYQNNQVTITYGLNAQDNGGNDASATLRAHSTYFNLYNVNVANSYGSGKQASAVAVCEAKSLNTFT